MGTFQILETGRLFAAILSLLYGFIFVLIRLEDTALLIGSIGLFLILAGVIYASRRINWYGIEGGPATTSPDHGQCASAIFRRPYPGNHYPCPSGLFRTLYQSITRGRHPLTVSSFKVI
ncbi:MAG: inner membrane CreD family protein [Puia sp.]|nr:inner membrane CreD family protein [Puia sp.]